MAIETPYQTDHRIYQRKMKELKSKLPRNWVKKVIIKQGEMNISQYQKLYNDLVNLVNGRSYKMYVTSPDLVKDIESLIELK